MTCVKDVVIPESLEEAYALGVTAEISSIALYESFLSKDIPEDVANVFETLIFGSEHHLAAFERSLLSETGETVCAGLGQKQVYDSNPDEKSPQLKGGK